MGVKWLVICRHPGAVLRRDYFDSLVAALEALNCKDRRRWSAQCAFYKPVLPQVQSVRGRGPGGRELCVVTFSERPDTIHVVHSRARQVLESEPALLRVLVDRLACYQAPRAAYQAEGLHCSVGDFRVKLGRLVLKPRDEVKALVVELEYPPLQSRQEAAAVMQEFVSLLRDNISDPGVSVEAVAAPFDEYGLGDTFSWQHNAVQYAQLCTDMA